MMFGQERDQDERVLSRWFRLEMTRMNQAIVSERRCLTELLEETAPAARTRGGDDYRFDPRALRDIAGTLAPEICRKLRLPIIFRYNPAVTGSLLLSDETAFSALKDLGELSPLRLMEKGGIYVGQPIVHALMVKYPTLVQIMVG